MRQIRLVKSAYPCMGPKFPGIDFETRCAKPCGYCGVYSINAGQIIATGMKEVLGELASGRYNGVYLSPNTDSLNSATRRLTHQLLEKILPGGLLALINTKQCIPKETLDLLGRYREQVIIQISVPTLDEELTREFEPGASSIKERLETIAQLKSRGISVTALIMPWLDIDKDINDLPRALSTAGATRVIAAFGVFTQETLERMRASKYPVLYAAAEKLTSEVRILIGRGMTIPYPERVLAYRRLMDACSDAGLKARVCSVALNPDLIGNDKEIPICQELRHQSLRESTGN